MTEPKHRIRVVAAMAVIAVGIAVGAVIAITQNGSDPETATTGEVVATDSAATDSVATDGVATENTATDGAATENTNADGESPTTSGVDNTTENPDPGETDATDPPARTNAVAGPIDVVIGATVIGGWADGAWRETSVEPPDYNGTRFTYFSNPLAEKPAGSGTQVFCEFIPDNPGWALDIDQVEEVVGVSNLTWDPRAFEARPTEISPERAVSVSNVLSANGFDEPSPSVDVATIVDIDGDGANEVILEANAGNPEFYGSRVGDYSAIVMRWVNESEDVEDIEIALHVTTGNEPGAEVLPDAPDGVISVFSTFYEVAGVADLNGDGDLELVIAYFGWEFWGYQVVDIDGRSAEVVLEIGCGV